MNQSLAQQVARLVQEQLSAQVTMNPHLQHPPQLLANVANAVQQQLLAATPPVAVSSPALPNPPTPNAESAAIYQ